MTMMGDDADCDTFYRTNPHNNNNNNNNNDNNFKHKNKINTQDSIFKRRQRQRNHYARIPSPGGIIG